MTRSVEVTISHLVMDAPRQLRPSHGAPDGIGLRHEVLPGAATVAAECYRRVGEGWHWLDRRAWGIGEWATALSVPHTELWTARAGEMVVGFFLLVRHDDAVEIKLFGLVPEWIGRRVGGWLLTEAVRRAWATGPSRVLLNTCSLDGPAALPNYLARGFIVAREERERRELPE
jgi:GNAT superfamily N-acetyltransferase